MLKEEPVYFRNGVPDGYVDDQVDLNQFGSYLEAYHRFVIDVTLLLEQSIGLVLPANDTTKAIYISGGFARNPIFVPLMAMLHPDKKVYTSEIDNSTALGAAIVMWEQLGLKGQPPLDLGLKSWSGF
jgi:sugar (pentulose or hexulose) kinase